MGEIDFDSAERRLEPRVDIGNEAVLVDLLDGREPITCCIWDISLKGARLLVPSGVQMPAQFKIISGNHSRAAFSIWQQGPYVGIKYVEHVGEGT